MKKTLYAIILIFSLPNVLFGSTIITPNDLTHVGSFNSPSALSYISGITLRRINGTLYIYTLVRAGATRGNVYRYPVPGDGSITTGTPFYTVPDNQVVSYGDIFQDKIVDINDSGSDGNPPVTGVANVNLDNSALYWDETDSRMYWVHTIPYENYVNSAITSNTVIGYSTLDDDLNTGTGIGTWKLSPPHPEGYGNRWAFNMASIPSAYRSALGGRRLVVGFGGSVSVISNGPGSIGPTAFAINPPSLATEDHLDYMFTSPLRLISHLYGVEDLPLRAAEMPGTNMRVDPYTSDKWFHEDFCRSGVWIDWGGKRGLLFFAKMGGGSTDTTVTEIISTSQVRVANVGDLQVGDVCRVDVTNPSNGAYWFEVRKLTGVSGDVVTFDSPVTQGIILNGAIQTGSFYYGGGPVTSHSWTPLYIYDPDDLMLSITDPSGHPPGGEQPEYNSNFEFPDNTYPLDGESPSYSTYGFPVGASFDEDTGRVYIATSRSSGKHAIHIYQVRSGITNAESRPSGSIVSIGASGTSVSIRQ